MQRTGKFICIFTVIILTSSSPDRKFAQAIWMIFCKQFCQSHVISAANQPTDTIDSSLPRITDQRRVHEIYVNLCGQMSLCTRTFSIWNGISRVYVGGHSSVIFLSLCCVCWLWFGVTCWRHHATVGRETEEANKGSLDSLLSVLMHGYGELWWLTIRSFPYFLSCDNK